MPRPDCIGVAKAGQAALGAGTAAASEWLGVQLHQLKHGDPGQLLSNLRELRKELEAAGGGDTEAVKVVKGSLEYLGKRQEQIRYAQFQAMGYPIGSGAVESANKLVVEARLKGSGMHWSREHVNPMVALRTIVCSDRWEETWPRISQKIREKAKEHGAGRRAKPSPEDPFCIGAAPTSVNTGPPSRCKRAPAKENTKKKPAQVAKLPGDGHRPPAADHPWRRMAVGRSGSSKPSQLPGAKI